MFRDRRLEKDIIFRAVADRYNDAASIFDDACDLSDKHRITGKYDGPYWYTYGDHMSIYVAENILDYHGMDLDSVYLI